MNLVNLYEYIKQIALSIPIVKSYYNTSVYECWDNQEVKYGSVAFVVKSTRKQNGISRFDCVLYYGDRLNENRSNRDSIQSDAIGVINNIINRLNCSSNVEYVTTPVQAIIFEQQFADELAGAYANLTIDLQSNGDCCDFNLFDDYYTKTQIDDKLDKIEAGNVDLSDYYTKAQIDKKLSDIEVGDIDLTNYYTKQQIDDKGFLTSIPSQYVTESELEAKGYLTSVPSQYVTENELAAKRYLTAVPSEYVTETELEDRLKDVGGNVDLTGYATEAWVEGKGYLNTAEVDRKIQDAVIDGVDLTDYYTKQQIDNKGYLTSVPSEYVTEAELEDKGYLTSVPSQYITETELENRLDELNLNVDLTDYYTKQQIDNKGFVTNATLVNKDYATRTELNEAVSNIDLSNYYTKQQIDGKGYLTSVPSQYVTEIELEAKGYLTSVPSEYVTETELSGKNYATKTELNEAVSNIDLSDYYTKQQIDGKGYLTSVPSQYVTETELEAKGYLTSVPSQYVTETELSGKNYATKTEVQGKQNQLVSGTNIKTINGESILGSGNIEITGGSGDVDLSNYYNKEEIDAMVGAVNQILGSLINDLDTEALELQLNNILNEA